MRHTHKSRILIYLRSRQPSYISSVDIERQATEWGAKSSTIGRRCRELHNEGKLDAKMIDKVVWYRITQPKPNFDANEYLRELAEEEKASQGVLNV